MVVRRTGAQAPSVQPPRRGQPKPAAKPAQAPAQKRAPNQLRDGFSPARPAPVALGGGATRPFVRPTQGEWTMDQATGVRSDPVTIYAHGSLDQIESALRQTGWTEADPKSLGANLRYLGAAAKQEVSNALAWIGKKLDGAEVGLGGVFGVHLHPLLQSKPEQVPGVQRMPVSVQDYRGQKLLAAFEENNDPLGGRDHLRIFDTGQKDAQGRPVYAIAASHDTGIVFAPNHPESAFLFHAVQPDVAGERDNVLRSLVQGGASGVQQFSLPFGKPSALGEYVGDSKGYELGF